MTKQTADKPVGVIPTLSAVYVVLTMYIADKRRHLCRRFKSLILKEKHIYMVTNTHPVFIQMFLFFTGCFYGVYIAPPFCPRFEGGRS
jgi:hypothetical protein